MTNQTLTGAPLHPAVDVYVKDAKAGKLSRREFMTRTTALGVTAAGAYGLLGLQQPAAAAGHAQQGGTLRMQMEVRALKDPRAFDWTQMAYVTAGWLAGIPRRVQLRRFVRADAAVFLGNQRRCDGVHIERPSGREMEQRRRLHR